MKKLINTLLSIVGLKLIRLKNAQKVMPKPNVDNIEIIIKFYSMLGRTINLLQVGACDGVTSDSIYPFIKQGKVTALLVEPSKVNFKKLSDFYKGTQNVTLANVAVAEEDGIRTFYTIKDEGRWKDNGWARQLASFYKEHVLRHGILESEISAEEVQCRTLATLTSQFALPSLDVILIDTEGYDGEIVKMALRQKMNPDFIAFENGQLPRFYSQAQLDELYRMLTDSGYVWTHDRINTLAVKKSFLRQEA